MLESTQRQAAEAFNIPLGTVRVLLDAGWIPRTVIHARNGRATHSLDERAQHLLAVFAAIRHAGGRAGDTIPVLMRLRAADDPARAMREGVLVRWQQKSSRLDFLPHRDLVPVVQGSEPEVFGLQELLDAWRLAE